MKNSASNNKSPKNLAFFETSDIRYNSEYGLYNSTGQLLKGSELFEQYNELAKQLDTKRSAFYLQLEENEIIFGCSLIVKAENGREERVVFIQVSKNLSSGYNIKSNIQLLKQFYEDLKIEIETFQLKQYQLIGLWSEEDFRNIKKFLIKKDILEYTLGKIHDRKKVSVKISELSYGLSLILELTVRLMDRSSLIFDVSQYPSESDVSISLIKSNPDFEIGENGKFNLFAKQYSWDIYREVGKEIIEEKSDSEGSQNRSNSKYLVLKKILKEPKNYCDSSNPIFDEFDDREKVEISQGLVQNLKNKNNADIIKILINIYYKIEETKRRKEIHAILFTKNIYIEKLVTDLIKTIYEKHDKDFFDVLFSDNTSLDNSSIDPSSKMYDKWVEQQERDASKNGNKYSLEKGIKNALKDLEYSEKVDFVKFIAITSPSRPKAEGKFLLQNLLSDLVDINGNDFVLKLSDEELKNLDEILDVDLLSVKKEREKKKKNWIVNKIFYSGLLVVIIFIALISYNYLMGSTGTVNSLDYNKTNNSTLNENNTGNADNISVSDNKTNNSQLNENISGTINNNSANDNKTNNSDSNETYAGKADNNSVSDNKTNNSQLNENNSGTTDNNSVIGNKTNNS